MERRTRRNSIATVLIVFLALLVGGYGLVSLIKGRRPAATEAPAITQEDRRENGTAVGAGTDADKKTVLKFRFPVKKNADGSKFGSDSSRGPVQGFVLNDKSIPKNWKSVDPGVPVCDRREYFDSQWMRESGSKVSPESWQKVEALFNEAKHLLENWTKQTSTGLPAATQAFMVSQLNQIRIEHAPFIKDPSLSWRGIGILTQDEKDEKGAPVIYVGSGYLFLIQKDSRRALFEMVRWLAQVWSPCELDPSGIESPWDSLLHCLGETGTQTCTPGSYSESGWAISTTLAFSLAPPACVVPVFTLPEKRKCLETLSKFDSRKKGVQ